MNNSKPTLFYSNYCQHCKELLIKINNFNLKEKVNFNCVDQNRKNLPAFVKSVPTIIVPSENKMFSGENVFNWVNNEISKMNVKNKQNNQNQNNQSDDVLPWVNSEMNNGFSDAFSFLDSDSTTEGKPIAHSFSFIDDSFSTTINTPTDGSQQQNNNTSNKIDSDYEALMKSRGDDNFNQGITRI